MTDLISREAAKQIATNRESHAKGETARACRGIAVSIDMLPAQAPATPCPCTLIEQDDDCPIGQPSLLCGVCSGTGNTTADKVQALAAEMLRIASDLGEPQDPFAAWENLQASNEPLKCCGSVKVAYIHTGRNLTLRKCRLCGHMEGANDGE